MKVITIVEDNAITGVQYGTVEVPENRKKLSRAARAYQHIQKIQENRAALQRMERTKKK